MMGKGGQATVDCQENFTRTEAGISARATTHRGIQKGAIIILSYS